MTESLITYALISSTLLLSGVLILVIGYLFNTLKKNHMYQKDIERIRKDIVNHSQHMLDGARGKAQEIISTANDKAQEIIKQTEIFSRETSDSSNEILATLHKSQKEELEKVHEQLLNKYVNLFRNISKDIEEKAGSEIKDFKEVLEKETLESQKIVGEKIESQYREVEKEIEEYRNNELQKLKDNIYRITEDAVELAVGKSLNRETHEDLVMDALKEAVEKGLEPNSKSEALNPKQITNNA